MKARAIFWMLAASALVALATGPACAQETPLVPPWGQDVDAEPTTTDAEHHPIDSTPIAFAPTPLRSSLGFTSEYFLGWTKRQRIPALLTTGPSDADRPGALDDPFTKVLYGGHVDFQERHGGRFTFEQALGGSDAWSWQASYFLLGSRDAGPRLTSPGSPILARPFFNVLTGEEDSSITTFPGVARGSIDVISHSFLTGAEMNLRGLWWKQEECQVTVLAGGRYLGLYESLNIHERSKLDPSAAVLPGSTIDVTDRFSTSNNFFGAQVGLDLEGHFHRWVWSVTPKIALGLMHGNVNIRGRTTIDTPPVDVPAGLLALSSNSGSFTRDDFAIVPEIDTKLGLRLTERLMVFGGYSFLYCNRMLRPGEQIDRQLNPNEIPTSATFGDAEDPTRPAPRTGASDFWAHGMTLGLEWRY